MKKISGINPIKEFINKYKETPEENRNKVLNIEIYKGMNRNKIEEILLFAKENKIKTDYSDKREMNTQGVILYTEDYNYEIEEGEFLEKIAVMDKVRLLMLDGVQDNGNFGALIRSAECFGVKGIILPERNSVKLNENVIKASTGAIEYVDIVTVVNLTNFIENLKKLGFWIYGAEADAEKYYYEEKYPDKVCLVLGSEGKGIRQRVKENCDMLIKIPMYGKINSLNVSAAGGIILAEMSKNKGV